MLEWRELSGREGSAMLSEWQGEDRAEEEETAPSCRVEVEPIAVEQPEAVTVDEREAIDDIEFFLGKQKLRQGQTEQYSMVENSRLMLGHSE